jgi:hypothetical protein
MEGGPNERYHIHRIGCAQDDGLRTAMAFWSIAESGRGGEVREVRVFENRPDDHLAGDRGIAAEPRRACVDRRTSATGVLRLMRRHCHRAQLIDEVFRVVGLVGTERVRARPVGARFDRGASSCADGSILLGLDPFPGWFSRGGKAVPGERIEPPTDGRQNCLQFKISTFQSMPTAISPLLCGYSLASCNVATGGLHKDKRQAAAFAYAGRR